MNVRLTGAWFARELPIALGKAQEIAPQIGTQQRQGRRTGRAEGRESAFPRGDWLVDAVVERLVAVSRGRF